MSDYYMGEIRMCGFNFAPTGWAFCNGQLMSINQHQALFSLLGTTFGGNGVTTFALPNLQSRRPVGIGTSTADGQIYTLGQTGGAETHTLTINEMPGHSHQFSASTAAGDQTSPQNGFPAASAVDMPYSTGTQGTLGSTVGTAGGSQPHTNLPPFQALNFIIALQGIYPSRN